MHQTPDDDYDGCFSEPDDPDYMKELDSIPSLNSSPEKTPMPNHGSSRARTANDQTGSPSSTAPLLPITPSRPHRRTVKGSTDRLKAIRQAFTELEMADRSQSSMPPPSLKKRLFPEAPKNEKESLNVYIIDSDEDSDGDADSDDSVGDREEVSALLTDTDSSTYEASIFDGKFQQSPTTSFSSTYSQWPNSSASSFSSTSSLSRKRNTDSRPPATSPSKYRRTSQTKVSSHRANTAGSSRPLKIHPSISGSNEATDILSSSSLKGKNPILPAPSSGPESIVEKFLSRGIGVDLPSRVIAYDARVQQLLDKAQISWGVQFELARGITLGWWDWDRVEAKIESLKGPSANVAYRVRSIILERPFQGTPNLSVWEELDREQLAIMENRERGLGLMGEWQGDPDWYGGKIQQLARLAKSSDGTYHVQLEALEKRRSHRLARYLGSRRLIQLRVADELVLKEIEEVRKYLSHKFILCGRVFVPLHAKDNSVYMVETNEEWDGRPPQIWCGDHYRKSFAHIVDWHNPLDLNMNQPISKWSTRFALLLSNSVPVIIFEEENIFYIDDIYASNCPKTGKAPAEKIMTDGCGLINAAAMRLIAQFLGYPTRPTAVQGRLGGGKGLWITHPTDNDPEPKIWLRSSQSKIIHLYPLDRAHCIFDVLSVSQPPGHTSLSKQSIVNLWYNGVPDEILTALMIDGLTDEVKPLMEWEGPQAMVGLWNTINKLGNVSGTRLQRHMVDLARAMGLARNQWGHDDVGMIDDETVHQELVNGSVNLSYTGRAEYSGLPVSMHECALEMLQAGFRPDKFRFLADKIRYIVNQTITSTIEKYMIPLPESLSAYVVPDPLGILNEGEIYYRSSRSLIDPATQLAFNVLAGDVLLGRYPVRLPSDIQKVKAVDIPELFNWPDVVIVSTKGNFSLPSLLSGGDCDGDELFVIREASLVEPFKNQPLTEMPPNLMKDYFEGQVMTVSAFSERADTQSDRDAQLAFQEVLLLSLNDSKVGLYSNFHDYAVFKYGYAHPKSVRLAYMFNILLDSSKTGLRLKPGVYEKDKARFSFPIPDPPRELKSKGFILHALLIAGKSAGNNLLRHYDEISSRDKIPDDPDLKAPYNVASDHAHQAYETRNIKLFLEELVLVRKHVEEALKEFRDSVSRIDGGSFKNKQKRTREQKDHMVAAARLFASDVPDVVLIPNVKEVKASFAYHVGGKSTFAYNVAFRDLCDIKAHADPGGIAPSTRSFDEAKSLTSGFQRFLKRDDGDV